MDMERKRGAGVQIYYWEEIPYDLNQAVRVRSKNIWWHFQRREKDNTLVLFSYHTYVLGDKNFLTFLEISRKGKRVHQLSEICPDVTASLKKLFP